MPGKALRPDMGWLRGYSAARGAKDAVAGIVLAVLLIPQAMAYAQLAGLPPQMGLFAALAPPLLYLIFGTSPFVSVGPVALVSLVVGEAAAEATIGPISAAKIIAIEAGFMLLVLGAFGLGRLVNFVSEPVMLGFTAAAAILIAASQLPTLLGIDSAPAGNLPDALAALWRGVPELRQTTAFIGAAALAVLLLVNRYAAATLWRWGIRPHYRQALAKSLPLLVIIGASFLAAWSAADVPAVSKIEAGLPNLTLPTGRVSDWLGLLPSSLAVAVIVFVTATAVAKSLAGTDRSNLDSSREAVALGAGNIAAALTGGYSVGASLSRSALVEDSGATSPAASSIAALVVLLAFVVLAPLLAYLPRTALAALVIAAVFGLVKRRDIAMVFRHDRIEGAIIVVAFAATLVFGVQLGLAIGTVLGLAHYLWFSSIPRVTRIGSDDAGQTYRSIQRDDVSVETLPVLVVRIDRSIYFGNSEFCEDEIVARVAEHDGVEKLILDMRAVNAVDASGAAMLLRLVQRMRDNDIIVHFAATHEPVAESLAPYGGRRSDFHRTVSDALEACGVPEEGPIPPT